MLNYRSNVAKLKCRGEPCPLCHGSGHRYCPKLLQIVGARHWWHVVQFGLWLHCGQRVKPLLPEPGDFLRWFIFRATDGEVNHGTDCEEERQRMNMLGWLGCWHDRERIWERLQRKAREEGIALTRRTATAYVRKVFDDGRRATMVTVVRLVVGWRVVTTP